MSAALYVRDAVFPATFALLPALDSSSARAMLLAICLQESRFEHRRQIRGPARGFPQFELGGVRGVMNHAASRPLLLPVVRSMAYELDAEVLHPALADNDILAIAFARLLLWTHPKPLPARGDADTAWQYYLWLWRPGKPHVATWRAFYDQAWSMV